MVQGNKLIEYFVTLLLYPEQLLTSSIIQARNQMGQLGLVPSNYLLELSQFLTQDVGSKNGGPPEAPNSNGATNNG